MATIEEMQQHLQIAHDAGNTELAQRIADKIRAEQSQPTSLMDFPQVQRTMGLIAGAEDLITEPILNLLKFGGSEEQAETAAQYRQQREQNIADATPDVSPLWRTGGQVIAGGGGALRSAPSYLQRAGQGAELGGVFGLTAPAETEADLATNVGAGALTGFILPAVLEAGVKIPVATVQAIRNAFTESDFNAGEAVKFAGEQLLPLFPDDVSRNRLLRTMGQYLDQVDPTSTRQGQIDASRAWLRDMTEKYNVGPRPEDAIGPSIVARRQDLSSQSRAKYDRANQTLDPYGELPQDLISNRLDEIQSEIDVLTPQQRKKPQRIVDSYREALQEPQTFSAWDKRRSALLEQIRAEKNPTQKRLLSSIQESVYEQMNDFAESTGGEGQQAWNDARRFYREEVVPLRQGAVGKAVQRQDSESFVNELLSRGQTRGRESRANQLWGTLDQDGRKAARQLLLEEVESIATNKSEDIGFSPAKAATQIEEYANRIQKFFGEDEAATLKGFANYLRYINRASLGAGTSGTGATLIPAAIGGSAVAYAADDDRNPVQTLTNVLITSGAIYGSLRTPAGRAMLQKLSTVEPGTPAFDSIVENIRQMTAKQAGIQQ